MRARFNRRSHPSTSEAAQASSGAQPRLLKKKTLCALALLLVAGCGTTPKKQVSTFSEYQQGVWRGRAVIKDKLKNKTNAVNIDVVAIRPQELRIEVTTTLGIHLARFTMDDKAVNYILTRRKEYYRGAPKPESLLPVLSVGMDPRLLMKLLFDEGPKEKGWSCVNDEGHIKSCKNQDLGLALEWKNRKGDSRVVEISSKSADVQLELKEFVAKVEENEKVFHVDPPKGFRVIEID